MNNSEYYVPISTQVPDNMQVERRNEEFLQSINDWMTPEELCVLLKYEIRQTYYED